MMWQLIEDFKMSLIEDGKSPKTIEIYVCDIKAFKEFLTARRLNNIIYGMMKNKTEYVMPNVEIKEVV